MQKYYQKIKNFGVTPSDSRREQQGTTLLNQIILALLILQTLLYPDFLLQGNTTALIIIITIQFFTIIPLILNYFHKKNAARCYFNIVFVIFMTAIICSHGEALKADSSYLIFAITTILFFQKSIHRIFLFSLIIAAYFFSIYYTAHYPAIFEAHVNFTTKTIMFLATLTCIVITINQFVNESFAYEKKLEVALKDIKSHQIEITKQNEALAQANQELERFAYISSHNLKTPVRTIRSFTDLVSRDVKKGNLEHLEEYLGFIKQGANQMQLLITDILEYSQINQNSSIQQENVDLNNTVSFILTQLKSFTEKPIAIETTVLPTLVSNKTLVNSVFQNLIENAIKYNQNTKANIKIDYETLEDAYIFSFKDNGIGISKEYHDKIFNMFERLNSNSDYEGSGIGLAMSKKIVENLNGRIWLTSEEGKGSTFFVKLPK